MNTKFLMSVVAIFVLAMVVGFVVHGALLNADYAQLPNLMRTQEDAGRHFPFMVAAHVLMAIGLTWIYRRGRENRPWLGQGLRFGLAVAILSTIPIYLIYHAVCPFPLGLAMKQIVFDTIGMMLMGVVVAWINRS